MEVPCRIYIGPALSSSRLVPMENLKAQLRPFLAPSAPTRRRRLTEEEECAYAERARRRPARLAAALSTSTGKGENLFGAQGLRV
jgi:hypothetical protein